MDDRTWQLTMNLLAAVGPDADPRVTALVHLGAAVMLFGEFNLETANELPATID
jgi:hypothetical protein